MDEHEMLEIAKRANELGVGYYIVKDAGHTQVSPGSKTVIALGPGTDEELDVISGHLKLL